MQQVFDTTFLHNQQTGHVFMGCLSDIGEASQGVGVKICCLVKADA